MPKNWSATWCARQADPFSGAAVYQGKAQTLVLGNYLILDKIGAAAWARCSGRHRRMDRIVALKVLPEAPDSPDAVARFQREVKGRGPAHASQYRHGLRCRRSRRHALPGDGIRRRQRSGRPGQAARPVAGQPGRRFHAASGPRLGACPRRRRGASRHQAFEPAAGQEGHGQDSRHGPGPA